MACVQYYYYYYYTTLCAGRFTLAVGTYAGDTHPGRRRRPSMNTNKRPPRLRLRSRCSPDRFARIRPSYHPLFFEFIGEV